MNCRPELEPQGFVSALLNVFKEMYELSLVIGKQGSDQQAFRESRDWGMRLISVTFGESDPINQQFSTAHQLKESRNKGRERE